MLTTKRPSRAALFHILLAILVGTSGCLRYTPSREEIQKRSSSTAENGAPLGTEQEFHEYERNLKSRLDTLIAERSHLLAPVQGQSGYAIGPGDIVQINVFGFNDLQTTTEISPAGTITLPLVGETPVMGQDPGMLRTHLSSAYSRFIKNPKVDVAVKTYQANRVSVIGEVSRPGMYPLRHNGQLLTELISEAGGRNPIASTRLILLPSPKASHPQGTHAAPSIMQGASGVEIEIDDLMGRLDQRPVLVPLLAGDTVVIPEAGSYEVDGEVEKPGSYKITSQASVMSAIAAAGGFTYSADVKKVEVIREIGNGRKALASIDLEEVGLRGGSDIRLRPGDLIRVPSEPGRFLERQVVATLNGIFSGFSVNKRVQ
jgi:polysaccharide export outer membrane protein